MSNFWLTSANATDKVYAQVRDFLVDITTQLEDIISINSIDCTLDDAEDIYKQLTALNEKGEVNVIDHNVTNTAYKVLKSLKEAN